jgi:LAO/AO transport system kinase
VARELTDRPLRGDHKALARAISRFEAGEGGQPVRPARSKVIGITGPPGAGKSTLISALISPVRASGRSIAVLAVDPSSPLTGGALLGDRIRMQDHIDDQGVFIRSMAARGHLGGLAEASEGAVALMAQAGFDLVVVETVGIGQSEVEVMDVADIVVLVVGPSWGDQIQADKAGVVEIADIFVVNKSDRPGVEEVRRALSEVAGDREVILTSATTGEGVGDLLEVLDRRLAG